MRFAALVARLEDRPIHIELALGSASQQRATLHAMDMSLPVLSCPVLFFGWVRSDTVVPNV